MFSSVQYLPLNGWAVGGHERHFSKDPLPVFFFFFFAEGHCEQFWHGHGWPPFDIVHPKFLLPTTASPTLQGALKDGSGEAVVACDMPGLRLLTVARRDSCGPTRKLIVLQTRDNDSSPKLRQSPL